MGIQTLLGVNDNMKSLIFLLSVAENTTLCPCSLPPKWELGQSDISKPNCLKFKNSGGKHKVLLAGYNTALDCGFNFLFLWVCFGVIFWLFFGVVFGVGFFFFNRFNCISIEYLKCNLQSRTKPVKVTGCGIKLVGTFFGSV